MNMNPMQATSFGASAAYERAVPEFIRRVFLWMAGGLTITGIVAFVVASSPALIEAIVLNRMVFYGLIIAEFGLVIGISAAINKISATVAALLFVAYSAINGATLSIIFLVYTASSVATVFFITAGMFGTLAVYGYITKRDLTSMGQLFFMGLIGIVIASVVNIFMHNDALTWAISIVGVVVFCGLTAWDAQKMRSFALQNAGNLGGEVAGKVAILGALTLYLDFINLFLMLLRLLGGRRN